MGNAYYRFCCINIVTFSNVCGLLSGFGIVTIGTFYVHGVEAATKTVRSSVRNHSIVNDMVVIVKMIESISN